MSAKLDVDRPVVGRAAVAGLALLALAAFVLGAPALVEVGRWAGMDSRVAWLVPVVLDAGLVLMALAATVARARREGAALMWAGTGFLTSLSVAAQAIHGWTAGTVSGPARIVAMVLAACPPVVIIAATEAAIRLVVSAPVRRRAKPAARPSEVLVVQEPPVRPVVKRSRPVTVGPEERTALQARVVELARAGRPHRAIAAEMGVSKSTVTRWANAA